MIRYLIPCFVVCVIGIVIIEAVSYYLQAWYTMTYLENYPEANLTFNSIRDHADMRLYYAAYYARVFLIPIWSVCCLWFTVKIFYRREIKAPVDVLSKASERILDDDLDFKVECDSQNELGRLCGSFENMRKNLYDSNYKLWKSLEERKRLNSAFSHDLRTPITVLKGYMELIEQFDGKLSPDKLSDILGKMSGQVTRLENYTEKMNSIHKLEDIIPDVKGITFGDICAQLEENGSLICGSGYSFNAEGDSYDMLYTDIELVLQVFMNLASNAMRYRKSRIDCTALNGVEEFTVTVSDDGCGFSEEALRKAWQPFYRADDENDKEHFGLGLYICWLLCRKAGGSLTVENNENGGGKVTANFSKNISEKQINN